MTHPKNQIKAKGRKYSIISPFWSLNDDIKLSAAAKEEEQKVLELYFNDIYKLFLRKLSTFEAKHQISKSEKENLSALFEEIIAVKNLLHDDK